MSIEDVEARFRGEQARIDALAGQLTDLVTGPIEAAIDECHRFADDVAKARRFIENIETGAA